MSTSAARQSVADMLARSLRERHSCRGFRSTPVAADVVERILDTARHTASWCNAQPWRVWLLEGEVLNSFRDDLLAHVAMAPSSPDLTWPREYKDEFLMRRRESGRALYAAAGVARGDQEAAARQARENFRLFGAPHLLIVTSPEPLGVYAVADSVAWVHNFMLAAHCEGVATIAQASIAAHAAWLHRRLRIPEDRQIVCGISFGFEDPKHPANQFRTSRAPLNETLVRVDAGALSL